jgi:hypothetical protein
MDQENQHIELEKLLNEYILIEQSIISSKIENDI